MAQALPVFTREPQRIIMVYDHALGRHVERKMGEYLAERAQYTALGQMMAKWGLEING